MGSVVGEKIAHAFEEATQRRIPLVSVAASGGARVQEGMFSLMQMAKVAAAASVHDRQRAGIHIHIDGSDLWRRYRQLRLAWGHLDCRAGRADRIRRAARDRANHGRCAAEGFAPRGHVAPVRD